jgi:hypothetical protein
VDLPRPREIHIMKEPEFQEIVFRVRTLLGVA